MDERVVNTLLSALCVGLLSIASTAFLPTGAGRLGGLVTLALVGIGAYAVVAGQVGTLGRTTAVVYASLLCLSVAAGLAEQVVAVDVSRGLGNGATAVAFGVYVGLVYAVTPHVRRWLSHGRGSPDS